MTLATISDIIKKDVESDFKKRYKNNPQVSEGVGKSILIDNSPEFYSLHQRDSSKIFDIPYLTAYKSRGVQEALQFQQSKPRKNKVLILNVMKFM